MNIHYRIYDCTEEKGTTEHGAKLEWYRGCNGETHVDTLCEVWYADGEVDYAKELAVVERGACDKTCSSERRGEFIHPKAALDELVATVGT